MNLASVAHKITVFKEQNQQNMNLKKGIVENSLRFLDLCRTPETDSIEPRLRTTGVVKCIYTYTCITFDLHDVVVDIVTGRDVAGSDVTGSDITARGTDSRFAFVVSTNKRRRFGFDGRTLVGMFI